MMQAPLFSRIAPSYDRLNRLMTFGMDVFWRRAAVKLLPPATDILDLACGTGDVTRLLARRFPKATVRGLDLSAEMLEIARRKCPGSVFTEGDVVKTDWGHPTAITCAFGFRNFPNKEAVLAKAAAVLPPGGHLLVLELWRPGPLVRAFLGVWLRVTTALYVRLAKAEYEYLRRSIMATLTPAAFAVLAEKAGFRAAARRRFFPAAEVVCWEKPGT